MHVRIPRVDFDASAHPLWTGQLALHGAIPGSEPAPAGTRWQVSLLEDGLCCDIAGKASLFLPRNRIRAASAIQLPNGGNAVALRVAGETGDADLLLQPVISLLGRRGGRAAALLDALAAWGVTISRIAPPPMLTDPSGSTWKPIEDSVVWAGRASLPSHPWLPLQPAHAWVTTRALRWSIDGVGACRLQIDDIREATVVHGDRQPAEAVVTYEAGGAHHALAVRFDLYGADRSSRERGAFLVALRSRGIAVRAGEHPTLPAPLSRASSRPANPFRSPATPVAHRPRIAAPGSAPAGDLATARSVEADLLEDLHSLNRALAGGFRLQREHGLGARLGSGLADLEAAELGERVPAREIAGRRNRMLALAEATARLRALADQRERGLIDAAAVELRRQAILAPLGDLLLG